MTDQQRNSSTQALVHKIDLFEQIGVLWKGKWIVIATTFAFAVGSIVFALSQPNIYRSEAVLAPVEDGGGMKIPGQLGGLAALAGVNIGGGGGSKVELALEVMKSREFLGRFIEKNKLKVPIMAVKGWELASNTLVIDADIYNEEAKSWVREVKLPLKPEPSLLEAYEEFRQRLKINQNDKSGIVKVSIDYYSPYLAADWTRLLVHEVNEEMRKRESEEAIRSISYLEEQLGKTNLADVQSMLYALIEEQTKTLMLANVRDEYVLQTIDPAIVPEKKSKPSRALMVIIGTFIGGVLGSTFVLVQNVYRQRKEEETF